MRVAALEKPRVNGASRNGATTWVMSRVRSSKNSANDESTDKEEDVTVEARIAKVGSHHDTSTLLHY